MYNNMTNLVNAYKASFKADLVSNARFLEREFVAGVPTSMANKIVFDIFVQTT